MLGSTFDSLEAWHNERVVKPWLGPLAMTRAFVLTTFVLAMVAVFANVKVRYEQGQIWEASPEITEISGAMSFSTADAPYFLGHAAAISNGIAPEEYRSKRNYPNYVLSGDKATNIEPPPIPFLSRIISWTARSPSPKDLLQAGHTWLLVSAGVTAALIIFAFGVCGYWLEGTVAALGGGLSSAYLVRSSFGRIDTDQLNLGLMYLMFGLVVLAASAKRTASLFLGCIAAGIGGRIFLIWYGKPELIWMAIIAYAWLLFVNRVGIYKSIACMLLFYFLTNPILPNPFASSYVQIHFAHEQLLFPNTFQTISEAQRISVGEIFRQMTGSIEMGLVAFFGLLLWGIRHPVLAIAYGPLVAFAILNLFIGNRAVFYSAPIFWFGAAFLISSTARFVFYELLNHCKNEGSINLQPSLFAVLISIAIAWVNSPTNYIPKPSFPRPVLEGLLSLNRISGGKPSVVATWWDYGYASLFLNGLPTLHDGGYQVTPATHFFAKSILQSDQRQLVKTLQFLASNNTDDIASYENSTALNAAFAEPSTGPIPDIYLILTKQMEGWIASISTLGNWDIDTGKPIIPENNSSKAHLNYIQLGCTYRGFPKALDCGNNRFDFESGLINGRSAIVGWTWARDGFVKKVFRYNKSASLGVQTLQTNNRLSSQLVHRHLYESSFNKLYHFGLIETSGVSLIYDDYPNIRIYKIAGQAE